MNGSIATVALTDAAGRDLGVARTEAVNNAGRSIGDFEPGPDYDHIKAVFDFFSEMVEHQMFSYSDSVDSQIAAFGLMVSVDGAPPVPASDVQIYTDGGFSCRLPAPAAP